MPLVNCSLYLFQLLFMINKNVNINDKSPVIFQVFNCLFEGVYKLQNNLDLVNENHCKVEIKKHFASQMVIIKT